MIVASRETDVKIATLLGLDCSFVVATQYLVPQYNEWYFEDYRPEGLKLTQVPKYSSEIAAATHILYEFSTVTIERVCDGDWNVDGRLRKNGEHGWGYGSDLKLAICHAFLNAHGVKEI